MCNYLQCESICIRSEVFHSGPIALRLLRLTVTLILIYPNLNFVLDILAKINSLVCIIIIQWGLPRSTLARVSGFALDQRHYNLDNLQ